MKFILKLLLAPLMLVLWIVEWALTLALKASAVVCVIASALFLLSGFFYFVDGNVQNGCIEKDSFNVRVLSDQRNIFSHD